MNEQKETAYNLFRCKDRGIIGQRIHLQCYQSMLSNKKDLKWLTDNKIKSAQQCKAKMEVKPCRK